MRFLISDYSGHPFQVQLSRELARRGHQVRHVHFAGFQTPKGNLSNQPDDPPGLEIVGVTINQPFAKASFVRRWRQENEVGRAIAAQISGFRPDVVFSSNAPLDAQRRILSATRTAGARFIFWLQDIYSEAIGRVVPAKFPLIGHLIAAWYRRLEFAMLHDSDHVVAIAEDFRTVLRGAGLREDRISVIENWAPLDEIPMLARDNPWALVNYRGSRLRFVYSGTLGYKHNPHWLVALAHSFPEVEVCVFSEGEVAQGLAEKARREGIANLAVRPWVPFGDLPAMLGGGDVLVAFIEPEAGNYSVPSKILTYLAAGRPILCAMPRGNLAAQIIAACGAGFVCDGNDTEDFLARAAQLIEDLDLRERLGGNARAYALRTFGVVNIADRFLAAAEQAKLGSS